MKSYILVILNFMFVLNFSCAGPEQVIHQAITDSEETKFKAFEELERSILQLTCSAFYESYYYSPPASFSESLSQSSLLTSKNFTTNSVAGTGLFLMQQADKILILTCYHIFDFEDTLKTYYFDEQRQPTQYLQSLSLKYGQTVYVTHKNGTVSRGKVIAQDKENDSALIETEAIENILSEQPFQGYFSARAKIRLGQEVYLLGFPKGHFLVTKGLASPSKYKNKFLVDVSFNRGFSGGIVIMFDKTGQYQYVGMANSTAYDAQIALAPAETIQNIDLYLNLPYKDEIYIKELKLINYGITFILKSETIIEFFKQESERLKGFGHYDISHLLK